MDGTLFQLIDDVTPKNLKQAMQQAIEIEIATIPVYLYTYYSINRTPNQDDLATQILKDFKLTQSSVEDPIPDNILTEMANELALEIVVFANKAGALILSVAVEEMLHMSLSSNIKNALGKYGGLPDLVGKTPKVWPAYLPGHVPAFPINRAKLTLDQLHAFLLIETPLPFNNNMAEKGDVIEYQTIGQYYGKIIDCIQNDLSDSDFNPDAPQLISGRGYYAQNNIDTVYYNKKHEAQFTNANDSGGLIHVVNRASAVAAMNEIVEQGEGATHKTPAGKKITGNHLTPDGQVVCPIAPLGKKGTNTNDYDDKDKKELSHFDKFIEVYCGIYKINHGLNEQLGTKDFDFTKYFVKDLPTNPMTTDYPEDIQKLSTLTNSIYTYIFVMAEACYKTGGHKQYEIFMFGIHKSMIWILNSLCESMSGMSYRDANGMLQTVSATLEDYDFALSSSPKSQIIELAAIAKAANPSLSEGVIANINDLPDVPIESYLVKDNTGIL